MSRPAASLAMVGLLVCLAACVAPAGRRPGPYPAACAGYLLSERQCDAVVVRALEQSGLARGDVAAIHLLEVPEQPPHFGQGLVAVVGFERTGGGTARQEINCPGISGTFDPACGDDAKILIVSGVDRDIPCEPPPAGCAVAPPEPPQDVVAAAGPFRLPAIDIPIDHAGQYAIKLGAATLPNGYLSERSLTIVDEQPISYWIFSGQLLVTPDLADRPPVGSVYREPYDGLEPVTVFLEFEVSRFRGPGVLQVRDVVVR